MSEKLKALMEDIDAHAKCCVERDRGEDVRPSITRAQVERSLCAALAHPAPAGWMPPPEIFEVAKLLHTQNNRITQDPLFAMQQKRRVYGVGSDYRDGFEYVDYDGDKCEKSDSARKVGYVDRWEFVTGCFTEQGCKDYIAINGHNLNEPRIYACGSYRNAEFIAIRKWLMSLAAPNAQET